MANDSLSNALKILASEKFLISWKICSSVEQPMRGSQRHITIFEERNFPFKFETIVTARITFAVEKKITNVSYMREWVGRTKHRSMIDMAKKNTGNTEYAGLLLLSSPFR